jgi:hypothetical protein
MSYPWLTDSKKGTTPLITDYLEVASPNGLYLNSTNSQVLLKNPATSEKLTLNKSSIDFINSGGNSSVLINNTKIHLNEQTPTTTPLTTDITNQNIILQSLNYTTPFTQTLTLSPSFIQHLTPNNSMLIGNGSYATTSLGVNYTSTLNATECRLGYDGVSNNGDLYCRDITCSLINGYAPTTTGLIWSDFNNAYPNLLNGRYYLTDTTYETYQDKESFFAKYITGNQFASYSWNGINTNNGTFMLQTNGYNFDLNCATFNINGTPYSSGGGGVTDIQAGSGISVNQNTGSVTITNTGGGVTDIQAGPGIYVNQTTGSVTITNTGGGGGSQDLNSTLSYGNTAYNYSINMNNNDINSVNNIQANTINGNPYPPSISIPQMAYAMPYQSGLTNNFSQTIFSSGVTITGGYSYSVVWTFWYDGLVHGGGTSEMIQGYADLYSSASGSVSGSARQNGYWASSTISSNNMYRTTITYTDNYYISSTDTYYPNVLQLNTIGWDVTTLLSAVITRTN